MTARKAGLLAAMVAVSIAVPALAEEMTDRDRLRLIQGEVEFLIKSLGGPDAVTLARKSAGFEPGATSPAAPASPAPAQAPAPTPAPVSTGKDYKSGWVIQAYKPGNTADVLGVFEFPVAGGKMKADAYTKPTRIKDHLAMRVQGFLVANSTGRYVFRIETQSEKQDGTLCFAKLSAADREIFSFKSYSFGQIEGPNMGGFDIAESSLVKIEVNIDCGPAYTIDISVKTPDDDVARPIKDSEIVHKVKS
jgi:hypothetical protein